MTKTEMKTKFTIDTFINEGYEHYNPGDEYIKGGKIYKKSNTYRVIKSVGNKYYTIELSEIMTLQERYDALLKLFRWVGVNKIDIDDLVTHIEVAEDKK